MSEHPYASAAYAATLLHVGRPLPVPEWGSHVLIRDIPGHPGLVDAAGPYPLLPFRHDPDIAGGLDALRRHGCVSVVLVADALTGPPAQDLAPRFGLALPFKTHQLVEFGIGPPAFSRHHRDRVRRGERRARVERVRLADPRWMRAWDDLYAGLVARRGIAGVAAFPPASFAALARLPRDDLLTFAALASDGSVLAMQHWVRHGDVAYSHLTAGSEAGHAASATYALYAAAIAALRDCRVLDLGGGAGLSDVAEDGLARFKAGFANATATSHLFGAVLDPLAYATLSRAPTPYFPAYRAPDHVSPA